MPTWEEVYDGTPPWDIGRPQPEVVALHANGRFRSPVLDVGCGTGENALMLAASGLDVVGLDVSNNAVARAKKKADDRSLNVQWVVGNALKWAGRAQAFETILDSGLFHVFDDDDRRRYVRALRRFLRPGGWLHVLCFSDVEPTEWGGPRRVSRNELAQAFADGWDSHEIEPVAFHTRIHEAGGRAWRASFRRTLD